MPRSRLLRGIYAILDPSAGADCEALLRALLAGGIRLFQYRDKRGAEPVSVRRLHKAAVAGGGSLIVNDDLACALIADGLHVGQEDLVAAGGIERLRAALGPRILGISCDRPGEARHAYRGGADYLGVGPYKVTASKSDAGAAIGSGGIAAVAAGTPLPVAAIGGIELSDLADVAASGAAMSASLSAFARAREPQAVANEFVKRWNALVA